MNSFGFHVSPFKEIYRSCTGTTEIAARVFQRWPPSEMLCLKGIVHQKNEN